MRSLWSSTFTTAILVAVLLAGCSQPESRISVNKMNAAPNSQQTAVPAASATAMPPTSAATGLPAPRLRPLPPAGGDKPVDAEFNGYKYFYKRDDAKTVATFAARPLPLETELISGAVRDVVDRSYRDKLDVIPEISAAAAEETLRITGRKHNYILVLIRERQGEVRSLMITQLAN
jgi:hypothetical protein